MNMHSPTTPWRKTSHQRKVELIIHSHAMGYSSPVEIARYISSYLDCHVTNDSVSSVYRINQKHDGELKNFPLKRSMPVRSPSIDVNLAEKLWRQGVTGTAIAKKLGVKMRQVYTLAENNRDRFPVRVPKLSAPGVVVMTMPRTQAEVPKMKPDRVSRITISGARVTMPRVTFIDGPA